MGCQLGASVLAVSRKNIFYIHPTTHHIYADSACKPMMSCILTGSLSAHVDKTFALQDAAKAFAYSAGPGEGGVGDHIGKISVTTVGA